MDGRSFDLLSRCRVATANSTGILAHPDQTTTRSYRTEQAVQLPPQRHARHSSAYSTVCTLAAFIQPVECASCTTSRAALNDSASSRPSHRLDEVPAATDVSLVSSRMWWLYAKQRYPFPAGRLHAAAASRPAVCQQLVGR